MTPLDKPLKRALKINGRDFVITFDPQILKITEKGHRIGVELKWVEIVSGESALAVALHASLGKFQNAPREAARNVKETLKPTPRPKTPAGARRAATARASKRS
jgi:hypothetical protein